MNQALILGGVKSGKSRLAEQLASQSAMPVTYIATAQAHDDEMQQRILRHQQQRPDNWHTIETPIELAACLQKHCLQGHCVLVDCLTLWLTNLLMSEDELVITTEIEALLSVLPSLPGKLIMVSNETNMGITPLGALSRRFCDEAGVLHQRIAAQVDTVVLTIAGLPHILKGHTSD